VSRGQTARTRANFPRMKDRAYGRRKRVSRRLTASQVGWAVDAFHALGEGLQKMAEAGAEAARNISDLLSEMSKESEDMTENVIPKVACFACGYPIDRTSQAEGKDVPPKEDDFSVCYRCGALGTFQKLDDGNLTIRALREDEKVPLDVRVAHQNFVAWRMRNPYQDHNERSHDKQ
jgi:hypothetical protein